MTNNNMYDCADMRPIIGAKWSIDDSSVFYIFFFFVFLVRKCILVIHCCFQNKKSLLELVKKLCVPI
jgi:hypothetical protein